MSLTMPAPLPTSARRLRARMDYAVCCDGLRRSPGLDHGYELIGCPPHRTDKGAFIGDF